MAPRPPTPPPGGGRQVGFGSSDPVVALGPDGQPVASAEDTYDSDTETLVGDVEENERILQQDKEYMEKQAAQSQFSRTRRCGWFFKRFFKRIFRYIWVFIKTFFHIIYAFILLAFFLPIVIILWIPWTWFPSTCPSLYIAYLNKREELIRVKVKQKYDPRDDEDRLGEARDFFAWFGNGSEQNAPMGKRTSYFFKGRPWELYELMRESWRTISRQGLQVGGALSGWIILWCHVFMMVHDFGSPAVAKFLDSYYGGQRPDDPQSLLTEGDKLCSYIVGTGMANWGNNLENLVWYGIYHAFICLLCVMLIMDEVLNVRMGLFAPQWSRMGVGYTIMFLVAATLSVSPNWGWTFAIRVQYALLVAIFLFGVYNVCRALIVGAGLTHHTYADLTFRNRRHPIRPWTEKEWRKAKKRQDFRQRRKGDEPRYWTEKRQLDIGDHCWQWQKIDRKKWNYGQKQQAAQKVYRKTEGETKQEAGRALRKFWHGLPITLPKPTEQDMIDIQRYSRFKHWRAFYGVHHWHPWRRWDKPKDEKERISFAAQKHNYRFERFCTFWFDLRRIYACACAVAAFALHIGLMCDVFGIGHWQSYRDGYTAAMDSYNANNGEPSEDKCQYYPDTHLAIYSQPGVGSLKGAVSNNMFWLGLWHVFMLGMCIGVFLVAFSNNRVFGMHLPWPVTLIGPRLSSVGIGWTMGFIAWGTLSLGMFKAQDPIVLFIARMICYNCLICWVVYLAPNERLGNNFVRDPFWNRLSERAFIHMDSKKFHREVYDFAAY